MKVNTHSQIALPSLVVHCLRDFSSVYFFQSSDRKRKSALKYLLPQVTFIFIQYSFTVTNGKLELVSPYLCELRDVKRKIKLQGRNILCNLTRAWLNCMKVVIFISYCCIEVKILNFLQSKAFANVVQTRKSQVDSWNV